MGTTNLTKFGHFPAVLQRKQLVGLRRAIQSSAQRRQNHQHNFGKFLSQKYPNSFSQNTKDHLHFPGVRPKVPLVSRWASNLQLTTANGRVAELMLDPLRAVEIYFKTTAVFELAADSGSDSE